MAERDLSEGRMMKWAIGVSSALILGAIGWMTTFITMGYKAQADIVELKQSQHILSESQTQVRSELSAVRAIAERTEKNTEEIRRFLLERATK
jgi:hypothetical protein